MMKRLSYLIVAGMLYVSSVFSQSTSFSKSNPKLIWSEEFNYKGLPDPKKWGYEEGYIRNNESQYYTLSRKENCFVDGNYLVIESRREQYKGAQYTSASINTLGKQSFKGDFRIEIRAKLPYGKGIWPALWMMGDSMPIIGWPKCVEFDIMEFVGHTPNTVHANLHWYDSSTHKHAANGTQIKEATLHDQFHTYLLERKGDSITIMMDDQPYFKMAAPENAYADSFKNPLYLLINTAIGGEWGGEIDDTIFPQRFYVDYVRVYALN